MRIPARLLLAAALLAGVQVSLDWGGAMGIPSKTTIPPGDFRDLPVVLGPWTGEDVETDARLVQAAGAHAEVNRLYRKDSGETIRLFSAVFADVPVAVPPHSPESCYPAVGYRILREEDFQISADARNTFSARLLEMELKNERNYVLFWYQVPGSTYIDRQREVFWAYRGKRTRPAVVKVLMEASAADWQQAGEAMKSLAPLVYGWVKQYQATGQGHEG